MKQAFKGNRMKHIKTFLGGFLIGFANTIPGVSGGTMAVILRMYDRILESFSKKNIKKNIAFLALLIIGMAAGILLCAKVIMLAMKSHEIILNFCFIGLIIGSIPIIYRRAIGDRHQYNGENKNRNIILFSLAFIFMVGISLWSNFSGSSGSGARTIAQYGGLDFTLALWVFICCIIATIAMLLPGISGSLMLLIFGVYPMVLEALNNITLFLYGDGILLSSPEYHDSLLLLVPIVLGVVCGLIDGIKLLRIAMHSHPQALYFVILGLVTGSIITLCTQTDFSQFGMNTDSFIAAAGLIFFALLAFFTGRKEKD